MNELHPKNWVFYDVRRCCLCDWESIDVDLPGLVDQLHELGPYDEPPTPRVDDENPPPLVEDDVDISAIEPKSLEEEESVDGNKPIQEQEGP